VSPSRKVRAEVIPGGCRFRAAPFVVWVEVGFEPDTRVGPATTNQGVTTMRFMMLMLPGGELQETGDWGTPDVEIVGEMTKYNEELVQAGILLAADGLQPPTKGARVSYADGAKRVTDGPFAEAKEVVGGYWIIDVKSKAEAVEWASRCPLGEGDVVEVRQVFELSDFPEDVQAAAELSQPLPEQTEARQ
jgi:hypothetical protein